MRTATKSVETGLCFDDKATILEILRNRPVSEPDGVVSRLKRTRSAIEVCDAPARPIARAPLAHFEVLAGIYLGQCTAVCK
jgi:hypothetical protein